MQSGIKGKGTERNTKEYINGKMINTKDSFRDFKDYIDWADYYINLLSNKRYGKAFNMSEQEFMPYIINAGYATDPNYINKYNKVLNEVKKYQGGGTITKKDPSKESVSDSYSSRYKNLISVFDKSLKRSGKEDDSFKNDLSNFTKNDSTFYTPAFNKLEGYYSKYKVDTEQKKKNTNMLANILTNNMSFGIGNAKNPQHVKFNSLINKVTDQEVDKLMNTDLFSVGLLKALNLKPKNISLGELNDLRNYMGTKEADDYYYGVKKTVNNIREGGSGAFKGGGRIQRFQNAGIITRDNTRMPTVIAPKLKEKPQIPIQNQTYLSQAPSKEITENNNVMQRRRELGNTVTQFGTGILDALKMGMSFANPVAGVALGIGDAGISTAKGDYASGVVQAGLEMLPLLGKTISKNASKIMPKRRFNSTATPSKDSTPIELPDISKEALPDYAIPNWQGDHLALTKERLSNGGFDRLEAANGGQEYTQKLQRVADMFGKRIREFHPYENDFTPEYRKELLDSKPRITTGKELKVSPKSLGAESRKENFYTSLFEDAPKEYQTPSIRNNVEAHEFSHHVFNPDKIPPLKTYHIPLSESTRQYLLGLNTVQEKGTELTARGTQIKNYFGLNKDLPITEDMLKYAAKNYVKDVGFDNTMIPFFKGIKDYKDMAAWLTKYSPMLITPLMLMNYD